MRQKGFVVIPILIIIIITGLLGYFAYQNLKPNESNTIGEFNFTKITDVTTTPTEKAKTTSKKLQSINIDEVVESLATHYFSSDLISTIEAGLSSYDLTFYRVLLSQENHDSLDSYFGITEFPGNLDNIPTNSPTWKAYSYSEASEIYTKDGFLCVKLRPNRFGDTPHFQCTFTKSIKDNSAERVTRFIVDTLTSAGIDCVRSYCEPEKVVSQIFLPKYSRILLFFEELADTTNDDSQFPEVNSEINAIVDILEENGWSAKTEDYTKTERGWASNTLISKRVLANNDYFDCVYTITLGIFKTDRDLRRMIECSYSINALRNNQIQIDESIMS